MNIITWVSTATILEVGDRLFQFSAKFVWRNMNGNKVMPVKGRNIFRAMSNEMPEKTGNNPFRQFFDALELPSDSTLPKSEDMAKMRVNPPRYRV